MVCMLRPAGVWVCVCVLVMCVYGECAVNDVGYFSKNITLSLLAIAAILLIAEQNRNLFKLR